MMHRGLHANVWLQSNSERSKPHVNVTQVIKVTSLQKIRVCHWGFFHAVLVEYLSISCNHNTTSSFAVFSFAWIFYFLFYILKWGRGEVGVFHVQLWSSFVGFRSSLCYWFLRFFLLLLVHLLPPEPCNSPLFLSRLWVQGKGQQQLETCIESLVCVWQSTVSFFLWQVPVWLWGKMFGSAGLGKTNIYGRLIFLICSEIRVAGGGGLL